MHYVSNVLGIRDPIHKQKIALKAMDVVLFGPPRGKLPNHFLPYKLVAIEKRYFLFRISQRLELVGKTIY